MKIKMISTVKDYMVIDQIEKAAVSVYILDNHISIDQGGDSVDIDKQGAAELIKVLQGFVDEKTKEGDPS